ncbi:UNKNOWN [Stylonychia lemnae]|uniref:Transmembrane protein n=1 Tax=Stylonychia lemnae TaxID=5949 RepID=A0A078A2S2_STYLE|nr:UNKNOWN [Stylonychia lemnae]|eukprot:CDW75808.1 UNKNOWN [Stylonychia lemnae]
MHIFKIQTTKTTIKVARSSLLCMLLLISLGFIRTTFSVLSIQNHLFGILIHYFDFGQLLLFKYFSNPFNSSAVQIQKKLPSSCTFEYSRCMVQEDHTLCFINQRVMDILQEEKNKQKQKYLQKVSTLYTFLCDFEKQKYLDSKIQLFKDKTLTVQKVTKGTFFRITETSFKLIVTNNKLSNRLQQGIIDDSYQKLSKKELKNNQLAIFEYFYIKQIYAQFMDKGKLSMVVQDPQNREKEFKVMVHDAPPEMLKKFCQSYDTASKELKTKQDLNIQQREEHLNKRKNKILEKQNFKDKKDEKKFKTPLAMLLKRSKKSQIVSQ